MEHNKWHGRHFIRIEWYIYMHFCVNWKHIEHLISFNQKCLIQALYMINNSTFVINMFYKKVHRTFFQKVLFCKIMPNSIKFRSYRRHSPLEFRHHLWIHSTWHPYKYNWTYWTNWKHCCYWCSESSTNEKLHNYNFNRTC